MQNKHGFDPNFGRTMFDQLGYKIKTKYLNGGVEITRRWSFQITDVAIGLIFCIVFFYALETVLFTPLLSESEATKFFFILLFSPFVVYHFLIIVFNSTRISIANGKIIVRKVPFPWFAKQVLNQNEVVTISFKKDLLSYGKSSKKLIYPVIASLCNGYEIKIDICDQEDQAIFLCEEINRHLDKSGQNLKTTFDHPQTQLHKWTRKRVK